MTSITILRSLLIGALLAGSAGAQLWSTPQATIRQPILRGFTAQGNVLSRAGTTVTLDVAGGVVVGVLTETASLTELARGIGVGWGLSESQLGPLKEQLDSPTMQKAAWQGFVDLSDEEGTDVIALRNREGSGGRTRYSAYVAVKVWPESAFPVTKNVSGIAGAPEVVRVFSDFQCPYCRALWRETLPDWATRPAQTQVHHYQFPLSKHRNATSAAEASECAGAQGKFWDYADLLFDHFDTWTRQTETRAGTSYRAYAQEAALDTAAFEACVSNRTYRGMVEAQVRRGDTVHVTGTPTVYLNGVKLGDYSDPRHWAVVRAVTTAKPGAAALIDARLKGFR
ncbi:DsbA family protein [Deinococcus yunweiensis]|uniref:DsbA family protein n=1 Tax=Deinococcus yunweiensis TaxID=367282 RepID=UPI00398F6AC9